MLLFFIQGADGLVSERQEKWNRTIFLLQHLYEKKTWIYPNVFWLIHCKLKRKANIDIEYLILEIEFQKRKVIYSEKNEDKIHEWM